MHSSSVPPTPHLFIFYFIFLWFDISLDLWQSKKKIAREDTFAIYCISKDWHCLQIYSNVLWSCLSYVKFNLYSPKYANHFIRQALMFFSLFSNKSIVIIRHPSFLPNLFYCERGLQTKSTWEYVPPHSQNPDAHNSVLHENEKMELNFPPLLHFLSLSWLRAMESCHLKW